MPKSTTLNLSDLQTAAAEYASITDGRAMILSQCEVAYGYLSTIPADDLSQARKDLSQATQRALAKRYGIPTSGDAYEEAAKVSAQKPGGIGVSTTALKQRAAAYAHVLSAGLTPDIMNVTAAFRLHSITITGHAERVVAINEAVKAGADFIDEADKASDEFTQTRKKARGKRESSGNTAGGQTGPTPQNVIEALVWAAANVAFFSDEEKQMTTDAMANLAALFTA
jgi:hypothetical protein